MLECTDHNADGICWKCAPDDQCPDWWMHLRIAYWQKHGRQIIGTCDPICARPRHKSRLHRSNAVVSPYANRDTWYQREELRVRVAL